MFRHIHARVRDLLMASKCRRTWCAGEGSTRLAYPRKEVPIIGPPQFPGGAVPAGRAARAAGDHLKFLSVFQHFLLSGRSLCCPATSLKKGLGWAEPS